MNRSPAIVARIERDAGDEAVSPSSAARQFASCHTTAGFGKPPEKSGIASRIEMIGVN